MDKYDIIKLWNLSKFNNNLLLNDESTINFINLYKSKNIYMYKYILLDKILKICKLYLNNNNIELIKLEKLDNTNDFIYWTICINSGIIYKIKIIFLLHKLSNFTNTIIDNYLKLNKLNRYVYNNLIIVLQQDNNNNKIKLFNEYFTIKSIYFSNKTINKNYNIYYIK